MRATEKAWVGGSQASRIMNCTLDSLFEIKSKEKESTFGTIDAYMRVASLTT